MYAVIQLHYLYSEEMINKLFYSILFYSILFYSILFYSKVLDGRLRDSREKNFNAKMSEKLFSLEKPHPDPIYIEKMAGFGP